MKPVPLHAVDVPDDADGSTVELPRGGFLPIRLGVTAVVRLRGGIADRCGGTGSTDRSL